MTRSNARSSQLRKAVARALMSGSVVVPLWLYSSTAAAQSAQPPTVDAGESRSIADTDGVPGETVVLEGFAQSRNVSSRDTLTIVWLDGDEEIATERQPTVRLADGVHQLTLVATDTCCSSSSTLTSTSMVTITVVAPVVAPNNAPTANAGADRAVADTNRRPGERVTLDASASSDSDGTITSYTWYQGDTVLGRGRVLADVELPDGQNVITLVVTDDSNNSADDTVVISVAEPLQRPALSEIALTPQQKAVARALDDLCSRLDPLTAPEGAVAFGSAPSEVDVADLAARCEGISWDPSAANKRAALDALGAQEFNAMRTPTVVFSQAQFQSVMDRLVALRSGQRGTSLAGLNLQVGDRFVSLDEVAQSLRHALGGGASADEGADGLLEDRLGFWMRGNYGVGEKSRGAAGIGFDSDQWGLSGGADYRFGNAAVAGISLGYGKSNIDFNPTSQGGIDTRSLAASIYGSSYFGGFYLDGVLNYIDSDYDSTRRIVYLEGTTTIDRTALGATGGDAISGGAAIGYDFTIGAFTFAPTLGYYYVETGIDAFTERNAGGLNLAFDDQSYTSSAANVGIRASYAWKTSWGVFIPHFRGAFVREFEDSADVFGVRFASDPFANTANPTPPIIIEADRIDRSYVRLAAGASAQFAFGVAGYFEYQRLEGYEQVEYEDFTIGLRIQHGF